MSTDQLPVPTTGPTTVEAYDRDHLRRQMDNLRRAAAARSRQEN